MISTQRSALFAGSLLLLFCAAVLPEGFYNPTCTTGCPMTSPLVSFAVASLSLFALALFSLKFVNTPLDTPGGLLLVFLLLFNPVLGLAGSGSAAPTDLAGTAVAIAILTLTIRNDNAPEEDLHSGILLGGVLLGLAPSFVPLIILPLLIAFGRSRRKTVAALLFAAAVAVWLLPLILQTGPQAWLEAAGKETAAYISGLNEAAHGFPDIEGKRIAFLQNLLIKGLGGYHTGGSIAASLLLVGLAVGFARGAWWMFHRETDGLVITVACISIYIAWLIFNPNDISQARHLLPLTPLLLFPVWAGGAQLMSGKRTARVAMMIFLALYAVVGIGAGR